jgi:polyphosphate kinase 2 (PPK2 family)
MPEKQMTLGSLTKHFRIDDPDKFRLSDYEPDDSGGLTKDKSEAKAMLAEGIELLVGLQEKLYADDRWSVLIILQAMDAAGKDSVVEHVMSGLNPQGVQVHSFKQPSAEELDHDFLWRAARHLPERGRIGIFNRSHYEEVLIVRVHPELLERQKLPKPLVGKDIWDKYQEAYEDMIRHTSQPEAPWFVVPADHKWFTRMVVAGALVQELQALGVDFPKVEGKALKELQEAGKALREEKS